MSEINFLADPEGELRKLEAELSSLQTRYARLQFLKEQAEAEMQTLQEEMKVWHTSPETIDQDATDAGTKLQQDFEEAKTKLEQYEKELLQAEQAIERKLPG